MFGYTLSEMIPSPPESVTGVSVDPPESECHPLLHYPVRKKDVTQQNREPISYPLTQTFCSSYVHPHALVLSSFSSLPLIQSKAFSGKKSLEIEDISNRLRERVNVYVLEPHPPTHTHS